MSIRPVDLQVTLSRSTEITRTQANEGARPEVSQQQFAQQLDKQAAHQRHSVARTERGDEKQKVQRDAADKGKQGQSKKKQKEPQKPQSKAEQGALAPEGGSLIDISV